MAIIIPSKNTYDRNNPKVRDNVIERIEVNAVEVLPDNNYDIAVSTKTVTEFTNGNSYVDEGFNVSHKTAQSIEYNANYSTLLVGYQNITAISKKFNLYIQKQKSNLSTILKLQNFVETIKKEDGSEIIVPKINFLVTANKYEGTGKIDIELPEQFAALTDENVKVVKRYDRDFLNSTPILTKVDIPKLKIDINRTAGGGNFPIVEQKFSWECGVEIPAKENGTVSVKITEDENGFTINGEILCGAYLDDYSVGETAESYPQQDHPFSLDQSLEGVSTWYDPISIEFTVNGDTIGIDLTDKTVVLGNATSKKVQSVEKNEFLQTSNTISNYPAEIEVLEEGSYEFPYYTRKVKVLNGQLFGGTLVANLIKYGTETIGWADISAFKGDACTILHSADTLSKYVGEKIFVTTQIQLLSQNQINRSYSSILKDYKNGKETATIRCSINKYYDEKGKLAINPYGKNLLHTEQLNLYGRLSVDENGKISSLVTSDTRAWNYESADIFIYLQKGTYTLGYNLRDISTTNKDSAIKIFTPNKTTAIFEKAYNEKWQGTFTLTEQTKVGIMIKMYNGDTWQPYIVAGDKPLTEFEKHTVSNFEIYDEVIPMVFTANGTDKPMSTYKDGTAKVFKVLGNKPFYDGAVWQEIYLQEK